MPRLSALGPGGLGRLARTRARDVYIGAVATAAVALFAALAAHPTAEPWNVWGALLLFGAMVLTERLSVRLPHDAEVSIAAIPHLIAVLLLAPWLAMALAGGAMLADQVAARSGGRKIVFNVASVMATIGLTAVVADAVGLGRDQLANTMQWQQAPAFLLVAAVYHLITSLLVATVLWLSTGQPFHRILLDNARFVLPAEFAVCGIGGLIAVLWVISPAWAPLILFPVVISQVALTYVSSSKRSNTRLAVIAEASRLLALSFGREEELPECVASVAVPAIADVGLVYLLGEDGALERAAQASAASVDPEQLDDLDQATTAWLDGLVRERRSALIPELRAADPEQQRQLGRLGLSALIGVPLVARERVVGVLVFVTSVSGRRYTPDDLGLAEELARRLAVSLDNARLHAEAQQATRLRDEFLSVAAHELKTPMTSLRGYAQLLGHSLSSDTPVDPKVLAKGLRVIESQSEKLTQLTTQLLDVSRLEAGKLQLDPRPVDLTALIRSLVPAAQAGTDRHELRVDLPERCPAVVDPLRLEQVVTNLLSNAIKYSPDGGPIDVTLSGADAASIRLAVRDRGIGIPPERRARLFDRFYQAHGEGHFGGLGLGLFISRQIVELHGGSLEAEFPPDGGTCFVVQLPRPATPQPVPPAGRPATKSPNARRSSAAARQRDAAGARLA